MFWGYSILTTCVVVIVTILVGAKPGSAQGLLIDDFSDDDFEAWTIGDGSEGTPWGPALVEVNGKGEFRLEHAGQVPIDDGNGGGGLITATWDPSASDPIYSEGTLRTRVRIADPTTRAGVVMRMTGTLESGFDGYAFYVDPNRRGGTMWIGRIEDTNTVASESVNLGIPFDRDLFFQTSAIGNQLSFKLWPTSEPEPNAPQAIFVDSVFSQGFVGAFIQRNQGAGNYFFDAKGAAIFDDFTFTPANIGSSAHVVPEPSTALLTLLIVALLSLFAWRKKYNHALLSMLLGIFLVIGMNEKSHAQATLDLGTFTVRSDDPGAMPLDIPEGNYNWYSLTTDWSDTGVDPWSEEAIWALANGGLLEEGTTLFADPGPAPNHRLDNASITLDWNGYLDLPLTGQLDAQFLVYQAFDDPPESNRFSAQWANTVLELSYVTPPQAPEILADLGKVADPLTSLQLSTDGSTFDTELAVYSSTGIVIDQNDDAPGTNIHSALDFPNGLPAGEYFAAVGGFNTTFGSRYRAQSGDAGGDFQLDIAGQGNGGALATGELAYVRFAIGDLAIPGDYNGNGQVEQGDLDLVLLNWGSTGPAVPEGWTDNLPTGAIDQNELDGVLLNWGSSTSLGAVSVPEPSGWLLLSFLSAMLFWCRPRSTNYALPSVRLPGP